MVEPQSEDTTVEGLGETLSDEAASRPHTHDVTTVAVGIDVGSTTVKAVVCDPATLKILWQDYQRHETRQPEKVEEFLVRIGRAFPNVTDMRVFMTGSGSGPLCVPTGARFVQEVNAVTLAVEHLHPTVGSVIELGGQDAKIIMFRDQVNEDGSTDKNALTSMNDKCASGTGATIDKCMIKVGMDPRDVSKITFDDTKLHHVAAKCGVFAETDIVNLVKSGIPSIEIMNSLADAIVHQNLSVLTRGNTLRHEVLLLGGPNVYLPFLVECWRKRIPETWESRAYDYPKDRTIEELIYTPDNAEYYAAFGAVLFGLAEVVDSPELGRYAGIDGIKDYILNGRAARLGDAADGPLVASHDELDAFKSAYTIPDFEAATFVEGQVVRGIIGLDGGSTSSKAVLVDYDSGDVLFKAYTLSKGNPIKDTKEILAEIKAYVHDQGATLECMGFGATGYAANVLEESVKADVNIVETVAHMMSAVRYVPDADVVCDIGGQDIKVIFLAENKEGTRDVKDFRLSNQCSAGNGMLLQAMADQFGVEIYDYADTAFNADLSPKFSYGCAVFLDADRVNFQKEGFTAPEMLAGLAKVLPKNVWQYVAQVTRLGEFGNTFVLQGGTQRNLAAVKAQVDYITKRVPGAKVVVHPHCGEAGAIGAAMETRRKIRRNDGASTFIGLDQAIALQYTSKNDEETVCHFCPNECSRTFIDTVTPDGRTSRYISGFSCEKGTVESKDALKILAKERNQIRKRYPNLVDEEGHLAFKHFFKFAPLPAAGSSKSDVEVRRGRFFRVARRAVNRGFQRSHVDLSQIKIGMPRVMNLYSVGPFFRTFFETLGLPKKNLVWSPQTTEELWVEGGRYGSIDPCYPSKVIQAHVHELLFHAHPDPKRRRGPLDYIYYPCITHVPSFVENVMDTASCPIVAGSPNVVKAAFTKEVDFFAREGIEYVDAAVSFVEPNLMKKRMMDVWGSRFGMTQDEIDWAVDQGFAALGEADRILEAKGKAIIEELERDDKVGILVLGRPYHNDPGLNHGIPDEFQVLGYPILSIRSIPKDKAWLQRYFGGDKPLDLNDVWPENFSANSVQKVWAARFAARHPNLAMLDLSSFKCGHDAPTYGLIDRIHTTAKAPYSALHDLDANKPGGSIQIRVKTYGYKLDLVKEQLRDQSAARAELARRVAEKRRELEAQIRAKRRTSNVVQPPAAAK